MKMIDLRSDTVTRPTEEMRKAMAMAPVGDDVYGEDPTTRALEELAAGMLKKEDALFVPSGIMGNQLAAMTHTRPGQEVICEASSHIFYYETGGLARLCGLQTRILYGERGFFTKEDLLGAIREENIHFPRTGLVCFENTHNRGGGSVFSPEDFLAHLAICKEHNIPSHLDGARLFNAAIALKRPVHELAEGFDSVSICLSKGLGAPVGSLLCGEKNFIQEARRHRRLLGGGMRQAGIIAAAGIISLEKMVERLEIDHERAQTLKKGLEATDNYYIKLPVESNIVQVGYRGDLPTDELLKKLAALGLLVNAVGEKTLRMVLHFDINDDDVIRAIEILGAN